MAEFRYGKAIKDSFSLLFRNLNIFAPYVILLLVSLLITPFLMKFYTPDSFMNLLEGGSITKLAIILMSISGLYILLIAISLFVYGWTFDLIGQAVKRGKTDLMEGLKNSPGKALNIFVMGLLFILAFIALVIVIFIFGLIFALIAAASTLLSVFLIIVLVIAAIILFLMLSVYTLNIVAVLSLEKSGPIETIKKSFLFYKNNKSHVWSIFGILLLISIVASIISLILYLIMFFSFFGANLAQLVETGGNPADYNPQMYSLPYLFFTMLAYIPTYATMIWSFVFITLSYYRKTGMDGMKSETASTESKIPTKKTANKKSSKK